MNDHDRSIQLAAMSVSERLSAPEATSLEQHLRGCPVCRREQASLASDHRRLRELIAPRPVAVSVRETVLSELGSGRDTNWWQLVLVAALLALLLAGIAATAGRFLLRNPLAGFGGSWTSTNCATWFMPTESGYRMDCNRWGDSTPLALQIGPGEPSRVTVSGSSVPACSGNGALNPNPPEIAPGTFMLVEFDAVACGDIGLGDDLAADLYLEPGGNRMWMDDDGDGWGLFWEKVP